MIPVFLAVHSQLSNRFLLEGGHITEKLFNPARHLQGVTGGSVLFKWLIWHVKNACGAESTCPTIYPLRGRNTSWRFLILSCWDFRTTPWLLGSLGIWGLDAGEPVFNSELEPLPSTTDSRAWNWKHGQKLGQAEIRHRPQRNSTLFSLLSESLV